MVHNEQVCDEESGDSDFDSFKTAPWDAGGLVGLLEFNVSLSQ